METQTPSENDSGQGKPVLLHACCAPCSAHCIEALRAKGYEPTLCFANDNLAHASEYSRRLEALAFLARQQGVLLVVPSHEHSAWLESVAGLEDEPEGGARCEACFRHNLTITARHAREQGMDSFSSSLSVSPHKRSALVFAAGRDSENGEARFLEFDFKKQGGFRRSMALAQRYGLYRQSYCGCEFSERPRTRSDPTP